MPQYNRERAVAYAHRWALGRNPRYYDFEALGGDCTNFASQCIYAGADVMNYTPTMGWYYRDANDRAPAWSGVNQLYNFLVANRGHGPYGSLVHRPEAEPGDLAQLSFDGISYQHSPVIVSTDGGQILVAAHTYDADNRDLDSYFYQKIRFIHIDGVRS